MKFFVNKDKFGGYNMYIKNKYKDEELTCYMPVQFKQGSEPQDVSKRIIVKNCFFSNCETKNGVYPKLVVMDYEIEGQETNDVFADFGNTVEITDDFLD